MHTLYLHLKSIHRKFHFSADHSHYVLTNASTAIVPFIHNFDDDDRLKLLLQCFKIVCER